MKQTFKIPNGCNRVTIERQGNRIVTTFEPEPEFKEGDVIYCKDVECEYVFIFKSLSDDKYNPFWCYASLVLTNESYGNVNYNYEVRGSDDIIRIATESEKQQLFNALAKENKQWNAEKKCIEDLKPKRWRAEYGDPYYYAMPYDGCLGHCCDSIDYRSEQDNKRYWAGNYFKTKAEANSAGLKMKELLKRINP